MLCLKILDITSLRSIFLLINLDMGQALSTQTCIFPICKFTKMDWMFSPKKKKKKKDQSSPNRIECTNMDRIGPLQTRQDQIRMNGQIRTNVDVMDQIESNRTKQDQNGRNKTNVYQIGPNGLNKTNVNRIELKWIEWTELD